MKRIIVVGGGAAGMMAAIQAAKCGARTILLEKNEKLGKKLYITGKGRCNLTNACDTRELFQSVVSNPKFLYSAFYAFTNQDVMDFFEKAGLKLKIERGNRVFPASDKSSDVIRALERECKRQKVEIRLRCLAEEILTDVAEKRVLGVRTRGGEDLEADCVVLAAGGVSYPGTGATDAGMKLAKGHGITELRPGLVGMVTKGDMRELQGLSCHICGLSVTKGISDRKEIFAETGELLFTHFGVSGPMVLTASSLVGDELKKRGVLYLHLDLKPWQSQEELDRDLLKNFEKMPNADVKKGLCAILPERLVLFLLEQGGVPSNKKINQISKDERMKIREKIKNLVFEVSGLRGLDEAIITRGGVDVREVNPSTMESKLIHGLYLAGEMLDLDALTGGFNLQIAWSTGYLAGSSAAAPDKEL